MSLRHGQGERVRKGGLRTGPIADGEQALAQQDPRHHPVRLGSRGETQVLDGAGGVEAIKLAIADMKGVAAGKKIELIFADHQNKADVAASKAREWIDTQGLDMLIGGTNSGANLAMAKIAARLSIRMGWAMRSRRSGYRNCCATWPARRRGWKNRN